MNTEQLLCAIRENPCLSEVTRNVYSVDTLPKRVVIYPSAYVCNTDPSHLPGTHWVTFWFRSPVRAEFYDSFGKKPNHYSVRFEAFLKNNATSYTYNDESVQKRDADTCGYHVLFYLLMKCRNVNLETMIATLKTIQSPDSFVRDNVTHFFSCM